MTIKVQIHDHAARIVMFGRFDFQVHRDFKDAYSPLLDNAEIHEIEVEMSGLAYMDSAALGMLILLNERAKESGKTVILLNASKVVSQMLEVANFSRVFNIKHTDGFQAEGKQSTYENMGLTVP